MNIEDRLLHLKKEIETAKTEKAKLEGKLSAQKARLKELGCSSIEQAKTKIEALSKKVNKLEIAVEEGIIAFQKTYGF